MEQRNQSPFEPGLLRQLQAEVHRRLAPYRHSALLAAIVAAFLVRPLVGNSRAGAILFSLATLVLLVLSLYNIDVDELVGERKILMAQKRRRTIIGWSLWNPRDRATSDSYLHTEPFDLRGRFGCVAAALCLHYMERIACRA